MIVRRLDESRRFSPEKMQKVNLFETERFFCDVYCLLPGQSQKRHAHPGEDKVYLVLEGEARVQVGDETARLGRGEAVLAPAGSEHGLENPGSGELVVLAFMAPHPDRAGS